MASPSTADSANPSPVFDPADPSPTLLSSPSPLRDDPPKAPATEKQISNVKPFSHSFFDLSFLRILLSPLRMSRWWEEEEGCCCAGGKKNEDNAVRGPDHPPPLSPPLSSTLSIASSPMSTFPPIRTHHLFPSFQSLLSTPPHLLFVPPSPHLLRPKPLSRLLLHHNGVLARAKDKARSSSSPTSSSSTQQPNPNHNKQL
ncbi:hypothetical protein LguiA_006767 [Lonicera macranthoides]